MAKGTRKLTISRSERFLGNYGYDAGDNVDAAGGVELREDDVWSMADDLVNNHHPFSNDRSSTANTRTLPHQAVVTSQRSVHSSASPRGRQVATSAPVNVPDWSKINRVDSADDQESGMVPPHEYLARSHRSAAKSVFEGVGRTLKGRDMSRVREAVWSQTGFDG